MIGKRSHCPVDEVFWVVARCPPFIMGECFSCDASVRGHSEVSSDEDTVLTFVHGRWGGSSSATMSESRGSSGNLGMDMVRNNPHHHMNQQSISSMAMSLMDQNDRFQMGNFRKY